MCRLVTPSHIRIGYWLCQNRTVNQNTDVGMQRHGRLSLPRDEHLQSHLPNLFQNVLDLFLSSYVLDYLMEMDTCLLVLMEMDRMELLAIRKVER